MKAIDKYFRKYNKICASIVSKQLELASLEDKKKHASTSVYSEEIKGNSSPKGLEYMEIKIESLKEYIEKLYIRKEKKKKEHIKDFEQLSNLNYMIILRAYYLDKIPLKEIALKIGKSLVRTKELKRKAIEELLQSKKD